MILLFVKDLIFSSKITEALGSTPTKQVRSIEELRSALESSPELVIINLHIPGEVAFEALQLTREKGIETFCFFSHVQTELKQRAQALGATEIVPRSKLTARLSSWRNQAPDFQTDTQNESKS